MLEEKFKNIKEKCEKELKSLEMWPSYFTRRYFEFLSFFEILPKKHFQNVLEVGCSIGYYSAFLSVISDKVTATDQPDSEITIHNGNLERAKLLLETLGVSNVSVEAVKVEELPFPDNSFDLVFSSHVFGYIKDQRKAINEIHRVLRPGGIHFCVVPARASTLLRLIEHYTYLLKRIGFHGFNKIRTISGVKGPTSLKGYSAKKHKGNYLFPKTQGAQSHWVEEVRKTSHTYWGNICADDKVKPILQISTQLSPTLPLLSLFFPSLAAKTYGITRKLEMRLGSFSCFKPFGLNVVLVQEKI